MSLDAKTVEKVAHLARIRLQGDDLSHFTKELNGILGWIEQLQEVDTKGIEPLSSVSAVTLPLRDDVAKDGGYPELIVRNASESKENFFVVPKVVE